MQIEKLAASKAKKSSGPALSKVPNTEKEAKAPSALAPITPAPQKQPTASQKAALASSGPLLPDSSPGNAFCRPMIHAPEVTGWTCTREAICQVYPHSDLMVSVLDLAYPLPKPTARRLSLAANVKRTAFGGHCLPEVREPIASVVV
jgi:hypothetical protein